MLTCVLNLYLASIIWRHKQLQAHPMKLFMYLALADSIYVGNQFFNTLICPLQLPKIWNTTINFRPTTFMNLNYVLMQQAKIFAFIDFFAFYWYAILTFYLILDLILVTKNPFADKTKYMKFYEISSPILAFSFATWLSLDQLNRNGN